MRTACLLFATLILLAGCGGNDATPEAVPLDIEGAWLYLGPADVPHTLQIGQGKMSYAAVDATWSSTWTIKAYDNGARHFQVAFAAGSGAYLPTAESTSGAYEVNGSFLTVQLAKGSAYPQLQSAGTCTGATDGMPVPDCRLYVKN